MTKTFTPGDVLAYTPERRHAREGTAFVTESGHAVDTYWEPTGDAQSHVLTTAELATAEVKFNVNDYEPLDRYAGGSRSVWMTYHHNDRARISSQHGLQEQLYVRRGAKPDIGTQIANAEAEVKVAESAVRSAEYTLACRRRDLAELQTAASSTKDRSES